MFGNTGDYRNYLSKFKQKEKFVAGQSKPTSPLISPYPAKQPTARSVEPATPSATSASPAKQQFVQNVASATPVAPSPVTPITTGITKTPSGAEIDVTTGSMTKAPPKDRTAQYEQAYEQYIRSLMPSEEEKRARSYLDRLVGQSAEDYDRALERGDTLDFSLGQGAKIARGQQRQIDSATRALEGLTGTRSATSEAAKARIEFEKSLLPEEKSISDQYGTGAIGEYNFAKSQGYQGSFTDYQNEDANRKKSIAAAGVAPGGLSSEEFKRIGQIADDVRADPDIKDFVQIRDGYERVKTGANLNNAQGDLSLLFGYMKLLDPTSVVRETEFANAEAAMGFAQQVLNIPAKLIKGNRLTPEARQQFSAAADAIYKAKEANYRNAYSYYENRALTAGVDPSQVLRQYGAASLEESGSSPTSGVTSSGLKYTIIPD